MTESEVYEKWVRPMCREEGLFVMRVEQPGVPDVYMAKNGNVLWGELKCVSKKIGLIKPSWRPGQLSWIRLNAHYGNKNICLILYYEGQVYFLPPRENYAREELVCLKDLYLKNLKTI